MASKHWLVPAAALNVAIGCGGITVHGDRGENTYGGTGAGGGCAGSGPCVSSTDGRGTGANGSTAAGGAAPAPCEALLQDIACLHYFGQPNVVNVLVVLDRSGSMDKPGLGSGSKWDAIRSAIADGFGSATRSNLRLGLELFPARHLRDDCGSVDVRNCCEMEQGAAINVDIAPSAESLPAILDVLGDTEPGGLTPTAAALGDAYDYFTTGPGSALDGDNYLLLVTDAGPDCNEELTCPEAECTLNLDGICTTRENCCDSDTGRLWCLDHADTTAKIRELSDAGVKTTIVALPGAESYAPWFDAFADAGGAPAGGARLFHEVSASDGTAGLTETFEDILFELVKPCEIPIPPTPVQDEYWIDVAIDCTLVPKTAIDVDPSTDPPTLRLLDEACARAQEASRVDLIVTCEQYI